MGSISFRTRLQVSFIVVIIAALIVPALYARYIFRGDVLEDAKLGAIRELRLAEQFLVSGANTEKPEALHRWLEQLGSTLDARITYMTRDGRVLADSHVAYSALSGLDNHALRPEIAQIEFETYGLSVRYSATLGRKLVYAATRVKGVSGVPDGILRLAVPFADVRDRLDRIYDNFLFMFGAALLLAFLLSIILTRSMGRSISEMIGIAKAIGDGEYEKRLRFYPGKEFEALGDSINHMAASIERHVWTITEQKREFEAILNGMQEGVMVLDAEGRISTVNPALGDIFPGAVSFEGLRPLEVVLSPELQKACEAGLNAEADSAPVSILIEPAKGKVYEVTIVRIENESTSLGAIVVFHDISELKRLERVRRDFVANVSHELRTPLTTVKGYAETLIDNDMTKGERARGFLEIILKNADHMAKMVDDLMSLSRLEGGQERFSMQRMNARGAMTEAIRTCQPLAEAVAVDLSSSLPEDGVFVRADFDRVVQVFRNLLENAIRYSPSGEAVAVSHKARGNEIVFSVSDRGPGIPAEDRERIFERFYRVEKHRTKKGGGSTGLGLAISKHIIERHGCRIWVESRADGQDGAVFNFTLPAFAEEARRDETTAKMQEEDNG